MDFQEDTLKFTDTEYEFLEKEFGKTREEVDAMTEDELYELSDACFDIELEGDLSDGKSMPDRCGIASGIVDKISSM